MSVCSRECRGEGSGSGGEADAIARLQAWRAERDPAAVAEALAALRAAASGADNIMPPSILCARAGVTTGEWAETLRQVFGEYRAPTGVGEGARSPRGLTPWRPSRRYGRRWTGCPRGWVAG